MPASTKRASISVAVCKSVVICFDQVTHLAKAHLIEAKQSVEEPQAILPCMMGFHALAHSLRGFVKA